MVGVLYVCVDCLVRCGMLVCKEIGVYVWYVWLGFVDVGWVCGVG